MKTAVQTSRVTLIVGSSDVARSSTVRDVRPTRVRRAVTSHTSPARTGPSQTQSLTALKKTVWSGATARAATTHAAMSIHDIIHPPCMTPRLFVCDGMTSVEWV